MNSSPPHFHPHELNVYRVPSEVTRVVRSLRQVGRHITFVPTMGALHEGHRQLICHARKGTSVVVVSIFVNPLQFGKDEDLDQYPRDIDADLDFLKANGVAIAFVPSIASMYPYGQRTMIQPGPLGNQLEGAYRPTHFSGMLTVVSKLLQIVQPHKVFLGEKDYQQLVLVQQLVTDFNMDVTVVGVPTVRDDDGLALSSRNRYLTPLQRQAAKVIPQALQAGVHAGYAGADAVIKATTTILEQEPLLTIDYVQLRNKNLSDPPQQGFARLLVAVRIGPTRLIDNAPIFLGEPYTTSEAHSVNTMQFHHYFGGTDVSNDA